MVKKQKFKKEYAAELLNIAISDLQSAKLLHASGKAREETIVFHVQQAIEKSIKAVICHLQIPILLIHDIGALLGLLPEDRLPPFDYSLTRFNDYAGILRYEEAKAELTDSDVLQAIDIGEQVTTWAKDALTRP
jgi:HEPN domain-containing protein